MRHSPNYPHTEPDPAGLAVSVREPVLGSTETLISSETADSDGGEIFDAAARMRELAAEQATGLEQQVRLAEERRDELLGSEEATPEQRTRLDDTLDGLLSTARAQLALSSKQATLAGELLVVVDPEEPQHLQIVTDEAEAADTLSRSLRALAGVMRLVQDTHRRATAPLEQGHRLAEFVE